MIKGIIFDLDGVLCFTDDYHYLAWKQLADDLSIYFDRKINERLRGVSRMESLEIILENSSKKYSSQEKIEFAMQKNETYKKLLEKMTPDDVSNDVVSTLKELKEKGYKLSIGSSSKNAKTILRKTDLMKYFDAVSDGENITKSKPDPEVFIKGAEFLGLNINQCAIVEDAEAGIDAGKAGGFVTIGIGSASKYELTDYKIQNIKEIITVLEQINDFT